MFERPWNDQNALAIKAKVADGGRIEHGCIAIIQPPIVLFDCAKSCRQVQNRPHCENIWQDGIWNRGCSHYFCITFVAFRWFWRGYYCDALVFRCELSRRIPSELSLLQGAQAWACFVVYSSQQMSLLQRQFGRFWRWSALSTIRPQHRTGRQCVGWISEVMVDVARFQ